MRFWIREGDTLPAITSTLVDSEGKAVDLTNASGVHLEVRNPTTGAVQLDQAGTIATPKTSGVVSYDWGTQLPAGDWLAHWMVLYPSDTQSYPTDRPIDISVASATGFVNGISPTTLLELRRRCGEIGDTAYTDSDLASVLVNRTGDQAAAAYDVWVWKAADAANLVNQRDSGSGRDFSDLIDHCMTMAKFWGDQSPLVIAEQHTTKRTSRVRAIERA